VGLPVAAIAWATFMRRPSDRGGWTRVLFAVLPVIAAIALGQAVGDGWPNDWEFGWRGRLDDGLRAAGSIIGHQLAPTIETPALRFFAIADITLLLGALMVVAWRRIRRLTAFDALPARFHPVLGFTAVALCVGLALRWLLVPASPEPDLAAVFPLVVLVALASVGSAAQLWRNWPRWGKLLALVLFVGWLQAAVRV
jgi:hypothetical protein